MQFLQPPGNIEMQQGLEDGQAGQGLSVLKLASAEHESQDRGDL
jgi:hypothetical protein